MTVMKQLQVSDEVRRHNEEEMARFRKLMWYLNNIERYKASKARMDREYGGYLERYFDENVDSCDGQDYEHRMRSLPMPYNIYFWG